MGKLKTYGPLVIIVLMASAMVYAWYSGWGPQRFIPAPEPEVRIETKTVTIENTVYLDKKAAAKEDLVPDTVLYDPTKEITAVTVVPEHPGETTVVAVIDKDTGVTTLDMRQERPGFFALESLKTVGIRCDVTKACNELELYGSWGFFRFGSIHLELYGEVGPENTYIGIGAELRF